jgi:outer membrane protein OmpA-like peptidoglycan-associated protein
MKSFSACAVLIASLGLAAHGFEAPSATPAAAAHVPLCAGLRIVTAISDASGDYESIKTISSVTPAAVSVAFSSELPVRGSAGEPVRVRRIRSTRTIPMQDLASSNRYARIFSDGFPDLLPGTTALGTSAGVLNLLKTKGEAELAVPDEGLLVGLDRATARIEASDIEFAPEMVRRVTPGPVMLPLVVNDARVELPAIHVRGEFFGEPAEFFFLDDPNNPIALRYAVARGELSDLFGAMTSALGGGGQAKRDTRDVLQVVKISYRCEDRPVTVGAGSNRPPSKAPAASAAASSARGAQELEKALAESGRVDIYSIFFSFNSDQIREESWPTIDEIAAVMAKHPDWKLSIEGHTDNIGSDADNLDLSRRRSAAVKQALVSKKGAADASLTTAGFGESRPKDTNDTLEGRARNRRVELVRMR